MQYEFICTKHNFKYGFDEPPEGYEPALLDCPVCAKDKKERVLDAMAEVTEHRNMLLNVIDLKQLIQPANKTPNVEFSGGAPLHGAASAGTKG